jgi:hypothetical protein
MATETLTLARFTLAADGDNVVKTFTGKAHTWDSWVASCSLTGTGGFFDSLNALGQMTYGPWSGTEIHQSGTGDPSSLAFEFVYVDSDHATLAVSNFKIIGTYSVTSSNHAKKSALAMSGH